MAVGSVFRFVSRRKPIH